MRIILTTHARQRMDDRQISRSDIEEALSNYHASRIGGRGAIYLGRSSTGRELKVVTKPPGMSGDNPRIVIITVAWTDEEDAHDAQH